MIKLSCILDKVNSILSLNIVKKKKKSSGKRLKEAKGGRSLYNPNIDLCHCELNSRYAKVTWEFCHRDYQVRFSLSVHETR